MPRLILTAALLSILPLTAIAQVPPPPPPPSGGGFGGGSLLPRVSPTMPNISPSMPNISPVTGGGFGGNNRPVHRPGWHGSWFPYSYAPVYPYFVPVEVPVPVFVPVRPPEPPAPISGESKATLVLEFPAAAEVWVNGVKGDGDPHTEWTLTSSALATGAEFTFNVKARWKSNGKTYEYEKSVAVAAGNRSRALVVAGTEVKE